jgi:TetR/AcrR family transcriptional repressor of nem operon
LPVAAVVWPGNIPVAMPITAASDTANRILDIAERLVQTRGYNAFSYGDIADELDVQRAAIHYHFATKDDLGRELVVRYRARFLARLEELDRGDDAAAKLRAYVALYVTVLKDEERICLCGMLASDLPTLPKAVRQELVRFFADNERWLSAVIEQGLAARQLSFAGSGAAAAKLLLGACEGVMLVARCDGGVARFRAATDQLLGLLGAKG